MYKSYFHLKKMEYHFIGTYIFQYSDYFPSVSTSWEQLWQLGKWNYWLIWGPHRVWKSTEIVIRADSWDLCEDWVGCRTNSKLLQLGGGLAVNHSRDCSYFVMWLKSEKLSNWPEARMLVLSSSFTTDVPPPHLKLLLPVEFPKAREHRLLTNQTC